MHTKTKAAYKFLFAALRSKWEELKLAPKFCWLLVDFEEVEVAAAQAVFGGDRVISHVPFLKKLALFHCRFVGAFSTL